MKRRMWGKREAGSWGNVVALVLRDALKGAWLISATIWHRVKSIEWEDGAAQAPLVLVVKITHLIFSKNWMRTSSLLHLTPLAGEFKLVFASFPHPPALYENVFDLRGVCIVGFS